MLRPEECSAIRFAIGSLPGDLSNDAIGDHAPKLQDMYAPETHATALDPAIPIIVGSRGVGKSFWSGVLGQEATRGAAAVAYPRLGLSNLKVGFGFTGYVSGPDGVSSEALNALVPPDAGMDQAKAFWWATILRAAARAAGDQPRLSELVPAGLDWETREDVITQHEQRLRGEGKVLLVVYDALDAVATNWPRRRLLTEALLEVVWAMRAYRAIKLKLFLRPDQIDDDALRFVELPKLRTGAVRLAWEGTDLYGLLFARLALSSNGDQKRSFLKIAQEHRISAPDSDGILSRRWPLTHSMEDQVSVMRSFAGPFMAPGPNGFK